MRFGLLPDRLVVHPFEPAYATCDVVAETITECGGPNDDCVVCVVLLLNRIVNTL